MHWNKEEAQRQRGTLVYEVHNRARWVWSAAKELAEALEVSSWQATCELIHGNEENIVMRQLGKFFVAIESKAEVAARTGSELQEAGTWRPARTGSGGRTSHVFSDVPRLLLETSKHKDMTSAAWFVELRLRRQQRCGAAHVERATHGQNCEALWASRQAVQPTLGTKIVR